MITIYSIQYRFWCETTQILTSLLNINCNNMKAWLLRSQAQLNMVCIVTCSYSNILHKPLLFPSLLSSSASSFSSSSSSSRLPPPLSPPLPSPSSPPSPPPPLPPSPPLPPPLPPPPTPPSPPPQGNHKAALQDLSAAIHLNPNNAKLFYQRGCLLRRYIIHVHVHTY